MIRCASSLDGAHAARIEIETDDTGLPSVTFEMSPLIADTLDRFVKRWNAIENKPEIADGTVIA